MRPLRAPKSLPMSEIASFIMVRNFFQLNSIYHKKARLIQTGFRWVSPAPI